MRACVRACVCVCVCVRVCVCVVLFCFACLFVCFVLFCSFWFGLEGRGLLLFFPRTIIIIIMFNGGSKLTESECRVLALGGVKVSGVSRGDSEGGHSGQVGVSEVKGGGAVHSDGEAWTRVEPAGHQT